MISVVICSRKPIIDTVCAENIHNTIGVRYEVVSIDNSHGKYNIFQAYNKGVSLSKGDIICFMHDDIFFRNNGWGNVVEEAFNTDLKLGALGVAGGHFMPDCPCSWSTCKTTSFHVWQTNPNGSASEYGCNDYSNGERIVEVASLDGLFMCIRRDLFETIRFDDKTFSGFHCYDSDICMQILTAGYTVNVTFDIEIEHRSNGACNKQYYDNIELWHQKWHHLLPIMKGINLTQNEQIIHQQYAIELIERGKEILSLYQLLNGPDYRLGHQLLKPYRIFKKLK